MKKRVFLALLAAAAVTFVGCSKDDDGPDEGPQTYTITFEGDDWSPLVVANYNGGKAMSVVYEDKAYTWTDQTTQLTSPCPEGWGYPFMVSSYNSKDIEKFNFQRLVRGLYLGVDGLVFLFVDETGEVLCIQSETHSIKTSKTFYGLFARRGFFLV